MSQLRVGIIGVGGLGSNLAVALAQEGVGQLVVVDPDTLEPSDLSRWPASVPFIEFGRPKVDVLVDLLRNVNPECKVTPIFGDATRWTSFSKLLDCGIIVAACDSAMTRRAVAAIGSRYLIPAISIGTGVFGTPDEPLIGFDGAVSIPGDRCLACVMGLDRSTAELADLNREFGLGRLGSLRSINLMAVGWALRSIEDLASGRLLQSTTARCIYEDGVFLRLTRPPAPIRDCFCPVYGFADQGL